MYRHNWYKTHIRLNALRPVLDELETQGHEPVLLGGAALAVAYFPVLGTRPFDRVVLWVPGLTADQAGRAERHLVRATGAELRWWTEPEPFGGLDVHVAGRRCRAPEPAETMVQVCAGAGRGDDASALQWAVDAVQVGRRLDRAGWLAVDRRGGGTGGHRHRAGAPGVAVRGRVAVGGDGGGVNVIVAVMDREGFAANTDVLVLVEPAAERLLWIPRDLWCPALNDRVNVAYKSGGPVQLLAALAEHAIVADQCLCLSRTACESALAAVRVLVPVPARMEFDYPLTPTSPIEEGRKTVTFDPPMEVLTGERVHQWIGARGGSDLHRLERQAVLVRRLLEQRFDFGRALADDATYELSDPTAITSLGQVRPTWTMETLRWPAPRHHRRQTGPRTRPLGLDAP